MEIEWLNFTCQKCGRVYSWKQLNKKKKSETPRIITYEIQCPQCQTNKFDLTYEIYQGSPKEEGGE